MYAIRSYYDIRPTSFVAYSGNRINRPMPKPIATIIVITMETLLMLSPLSSSYAFPAENSIALIPSRSAWNRATTPLV